MLQHGLQQHARPVLCCDCPRRPARKATAGTDGFLAEDDEDEGDAGGSNGLPIKLSSNRRADVSEFKGTTLVNIREYYEVAPTSSSGRAPPCLSMMYEIAECPHQSLAASNIPLKRAESLCLHCSERRRAIAWEEGHLPFAGAVQHPNRVCCEHPNSARGRRHRI